MTKRDNKTIRHYRSVGRDGKQLVEEMVQSGSDTARFLDKMEQRRLSQPCSLTIDMRGKVDAPCNAFSFGSLTHHLDNKSQAIFKAALSLYDGRYTVGVFESVMSADHTLKAQHQKAVENRLVQAKLRSKEVVPPTAPMEEDADRQRIASHQHPVATNDNGKQTFGPTQDSPPIRLVPFGYQPQRKDDRINYVSKITIRLPNGRDLPAKTKDLSASGMRVTLFSSIEPLSNEDRVGVTLAEINDQYTIDLSNIVCRVVKHTTDQQGREQLRLLIDGNHSSFAQFVTDFVESHKSRYKLETEDAFLALESALFERTYLQTKPIFVTLFEGEADHYRPLVTAISDDVKDHLRSVLLARLAHQLARYPMQGEVLFECFAIKQDDEIVTFAGERSQLIEHNLIDSFFTVAKHAHYVARLMIRLEPLHQSELPSFEESSLRYLGRISMAETHSPLTNATALAYYSLIEEKWRTQSSLTLLDSRLKPLSPLRLTPAPGKILYLNDRQTRQMPRYRYQTKAILQLGSEAYPTQTIDLSAQGLKLELPKGLPLEPQWQEGSIVSLQLPELKKLAKRQFKIERLPYRIMKRDEADKTMSLKRDPRTIEHQGEAFLQHWLPANRNRLVPCNGDDQDQEYRQIIESIVSTNLPSIPLFINRYSGGRYRISRVGTNTKRSPLLALFTRQNNIDMSPLNLEAVFKDHIKGNVSRRGQLSEPSKTRLLLKLPNHQTKNIEIIPEDHLKDATEFARFIVEARRNPTRRILAACFLVPKVAQFDNFPERVQTVQQNSASKFRTLEQDLKQLVAMVDVQDITAFFR